MMNKPKSSAYICVAPELGKYLLDYHGGELPEKELLAFEEHLFFCFHCQQALRKLEDILKTLRERRNDFFSPEELKIEETNDRSTAAD